MATKTTKLSSSKGNKLVAVRNKDGTFKDIVELKQKATVKNKSDAEKRNTNKAVDKKVVTKSVTKKTGRVKNYEVNITLNFTSARELKDFLELIGKQISIPKNRNN